MENGEGVKPRKSMRREIEHIQSGLLSEEPDDMAELKQLEQASRDLEASIGRMRYTRPKTKQDPGADSHFEDDGPVVPTTHAAIHNHLRPNPHPPWVWITKSSTFDGVGRLAFPTIEK
jgi:hypothetical protein